MVVHSILDRPPSESVSISLLGEVEDGHKLAAETLAVLESLREEDDLGDLLVVGSRHGHRTEELFEIVWQLLSASITLSGWIQGDEDSRVGIYVNLLLFIENKHK